MCCLFAALVMLGPRAAGILWWLFDATRWGLAFDSFLVPALGIVFLPLTTLMYVLVFPGGVDGLDWLWLALAIALDLSSYFGGAYGGRQRYTGAAA